MLVNKDEVRLLNTIDKKLDTGQSKILSNNLVTATAAAVRNAGYTEVSYFNNGDSTAISSESMLEAFSNLSDKDKVILLHTAIHANTSDIVDDEHRLKFYRETQAISLRHWTIKMVIFVLLFVGCLAISSFIYMLVKNGAFDDIGVVASLFKTINEVLSVIFLIK